MKYKSLIQQKTFQLSIRIVKLCRYLREQKREPVMSKQLLRSGTSIGANVTESEYAVSHMDFISKTSIALKECAESVYWLELLRETGYLSAAEFNSINADCLEAQRILTAILNTANDKEKRNRKHK